MASIYLPDEDTTKLPYEGTSLVIAAYGNVDFYKLKGTLESIFCIAGIKDSVYTACTEDNSFHPGRCANISSGGESFAIIGQIHPLVAANYDVDIPVYAAVIDFDKMFDLSNGKKHYVPLPKYPASTRDFSFVCVEEWVLRNAGP